MTDVHPLHPAIVLLLRYRGFMRTASRGAGVYAVLVGIAMVAGGDVRMMGPSYTTAVDIAEWVGASPAVLWGVTVLLAGVVTLAPHRKVSMCGLYGVVAWSVLFALSFLQSLNTQPLAGVSGFFGHIFIAMMLTGLIVIRMVDRKV